MEQLFGGTPTLRRLSQGVFGAHVSAIDTLVTDLLNDGYNRGTVKNSVRLLSDFGGWLDANRVRLDDVRNKTIERFLSTRFAGVRCGLGTLLLRRLIAQIRDLAGLTTPSEPTDCSVMDAMMSEYGRYLVEERGLSESTVRGYSAYARGLLTSRFPDSNSVTLSELTARDVTDFMVRRATQDSRFPKIMASALRTFLRYLFLRGLTSGDLASAVQKVADWRLQSLPKALEPDQIRHLLAHGTEDTPAGRRDLAILLLLARLGLRGGEVAKMTLDAIDWEAGEIVIMGKGRRLDRLPLPKDVGRAIALYLRRDRPSSPSRRLFLRARPPFIGFARTVAICDIVRRSLKRAGLTPARKGAHLLRHGLASAMLRKGASLAEIGQLLRHQSPNTTAIYAKVDVDSLRSLALPWPGGAR